jgi:hypothetical protein
MNFYENIRRKLLAEIDFLLRDNLESLEESKKIDLLIAEMISPKNYSNTDPQNIVLTQKKAFDDLCTILESHGCVAPKKLTVFEYYSKLKFYEKKKKAIESQ